MVDGQGCVLVFRTGDDLFDWVTGGCVSRRVSGERV